MSVEEAIRLVRKTQNDINGLALEESLKINEATAILALEYLKAMEQ